jgi:glutamate racemase
MNYDNRAIGVFDSGVGGLTVVKQIIKRLPGESIIYFGDTARIPYGTKSEEIVRRFALEDSFFLLDKDVKMIVVACNTASAIAIPMLQEILEVPVIGVIQPGALAAVTTSKTKRIGVIGTAATIRSNSYQKEINKFSPQSQVIQQACPLFVPMVEEGWTEDDITFMIVKRYLHLLKENEVDSLILGCTHYPLLKTTIQKTMGPKVSLVDSGIETAGAVEKNLREKNIFASSSSISEYHFYLSDMPYKFQEIAERFLERTIPHVETINFDNFLIEKGEKFWKKYQDFLKRVY